MIYTFYSYKGGVGRTMALANTAELFYQAGLRVLIVDWDLEGPGLERFFPVDSEDIVDQPGLIDMLLDYKERMSTDPSVDKHHKAAALFGSLEPFMTNVYPDATPGGIWLLSAGRRSRAQFAQYARAVLTFDWQDFYERWEGELYFDWLREQFEQKADVILIDSRTGVSEMGGICTYQLADVIVMLCAANEQNLAGVEAMAREFKRAEVEQLRRNRPLHVLVIPARLEQNEGDSLNNFKQEFMSRADVFTPATLREHPEELWELGIEYIPYYAYRERVAVRESELAIARSMVDSFRKLVRALVALAPADSALKRALTRQLSERAKDLLQPLNSPLKQVTVEPPDSLNGTTRDRKRQLDVTAIQAETAEDWRRAIEALAELVQLDPGYRNATQRLANARQQELHWLDTEAKRAEQQGDWARATTVLQELVERVPGDKQAAERLARVRERTGRSWWRTWPVLLVMVFAIGATVGVALFGPGLIAPTTVATSSPVVRPTLIASPTRDSTATPTLIPGTVTLSSPTKGQSVPCEAVVEGSFSRDITDPIWPIVYVEGRFYPQQPFKTAGASADGMWRSAVSIGDCTQPTVVDRGRVFKLIIVTASEQANRIFEDWLAESRESNDYLGLTNLPKDIKRHVDIFVTRQ